VAGRSRNLWFGDLYRVFVARAVQQCVVRVRVTHGWGSRLITSQRSPALAIRVDGRSPPLRLPRYVTQSCAVPFRSWTTAQAWPARLAGGQGAVSEGITMCCRRAERVELSGPFAAEVIFPQTATNNIRDRSGGPPRFRARAIVEGPRSGFLPGPISAALRDATPRNLAAVVKDFGALATFVARDAAAHARPRVSPPRPGRIGVWMLDPRGLPLADMRRRHPPGRRQASEQLR